MVCSSVGSSTMTGWKRRSSAASRSMYLRYSSSVVAPMHCSSPRESGGLRMLAASIAPSAAPAPTSVCSSSMKRTASLVLQLLDDLLEPLLELAAVLGAGDERADVEGQDPLVQQDVRHVAGDDPLRQALDDGRLADAGLADERRVVLGPAGEDLHDPLDLLLAADDRVELAGAGRLGEVDAELVHGRGLAGALRLLGAGPGGRALGQDLDDLVADLVQVHAEALQDAGGDPLALADQAEEQVLGADVVVAEPARLVDGQLDDVLRPRRQPDLADDRSIAAADDELDRRADLGEFDAHVLEDARGDALALAHEAQEQVLRADVVVVEPLRLVLRQRQDLARALRELVEAIHRVERLFPLLGVTGEAAPSAMLARRSRAQRQWPTVRVVRVWNRYRTTTDASARVMRRRDSR